VRIAVAVNYADPANTVAAIDYGGCVGDARLLSQDPERQREDAAGGRERRADA
jgi:hypothetical protein